MGRKVSILFNADADSIGVPVGYGCQSVFVRRVMTVLMRRSTQAENPDLCIAER